MASIDLRKFLQRDAQQFLSDGAMATQWLLRVHSFLKPIVDQYPIDKQNTAPKILSRFMDSLTNSSPGKYTKARRILEETKFNNLDERLTCIISNLKLDLRAFFISESMLEPPDLGSTPVGEIGLLYLLKRLHQLDTMENTSALMMCIRKRFFLVGFYLQAKDAHYDNNRIKRIHQEYGSDAGDEDRFREQFWHHYTLGRMYCEWAELAGGNGSLFLFPNVSESSYRYIIKEERQRIVENFREHGLSEAIDKYELNNLADRLVDVLGSKNTPHIPTITFTEPNISVNRSKRRYQKNAIKKRNDGPSRKAAFGVHQSTLQHQLLPMDNNLPEQLTSENESTLPPNVIDRNPGSHSVEDANTSTIRPDIQLPIVEHVTEVLQDEQATRMHYPMRQNLASCSAEFVENESQRSLGPTDATLSGSQFTQHDLDAIPQDLAASFSKEPVNQTEMQQAYEDAIMTEDSHDSVNTHNYKMSLDQPIDNIAHNNAELGEQETDRLETSMVDSLNVTSQDIERISVPHGYTPFEGFTIPLERQINHEQIQSHVLTTALTQPHNQSIYMPGSQAYDPNNQNEVSLFIANAQIY
ncbi:MAG: hypothetical protein M1834_008999 [Cirrosporium novae-zelandiae]|nr:MAG: hypothetical protein M1834_008999 [Cirrosporium novae-zelandiae]